MKTKSARRPLGQLSVFSMGFHHCWSYILHYLDHITVTLKRMRLLHPLEHSAECELEFHRFNWGHAPNRIGPAILNKGPVTQKWHFYLLKIELLMCVWCGSLLSAIVNDHELCDNQFIVTNHLGRIFKSKKHVIALKNQNKTTNKTIQMEIFFQLLEIYANSNLVSTNAWPFNA